MDDRSPAELIPRGVGLGCWQFGDMGRGTPADDTSVALIREAYRQGIRHFDTAHDYGMGHSEEVLGRGIEPFSEKAFVSTKMHAAGKAETIVGVEKSLARLKRPWIDLFYVHWPKTGFDLRPMMEGLELMRAQGKIRLIGVSNFSVTDMAMASEAGRIDAHQLCYNLLWRYPEREVIPWCIAHGVAVVTFSSIAQGLLSDTPRSPDTFEEGDARGKTLYYRSDVWPSVRDAAAAMRAAARSHSTSLSTLAIRWVLARPGIVSSLVGARSAGQIQSNVTAGGGSIEPAVAEELTRLSDEAMRHIPDVGNIFLFYP
jgi:aryl-alcohol dehydrogenase-like predicted oxidoreductase